LNLNLEGKMTESEASMLNALQLAYIGDAVWEMLVRSSMIHRRYNVHHLHQQSIRRVNAGAQARALALILPGLSETEAEIVRRGRNAHAHHPVPRNQHPDDYSAATGLEALIGYLYLTEQEKRLASLFLLVMNEEEHHG